MIMITINQQKQSYANLQLNFRIIQMDSIAQLRKKFEIRVLPARVSLQNNSLSDEITESMQQECGQLTRKPIKKNTLYNRKNIKKQRVQDIFKSIIKSISFSSERRKQQLWINHQIKIPQSLVNTLYRQNIRNYNPYITTLELLEQQKTLSLYEKERISNLCHIGIAKNFIKTKKYSLAPKYAKVNVLIRAYMRDKMWEEVKYKEETYDSVFFIPTNDLALTFNSRNVPKGVLQFMPEEYYTSIVNQVNSIITTQYVRYKSSNYISVAQSLSGKLILGVLFILSLIFCFNKNAYLLPFIFIIGVFYIFYLIHETKNQLERLVQSKNINETILQKINRLFQNIRTDMLEWKVGKDFYWLQIHYIKKKKRNYSVD